MAYARWILIGCFLLSLTACGVSQPAPTVTSPSTKTLAPAATSPATSTPTLASSATLTATPTNTLEPTATATKKPPAATKTSLPLPRRLPQDTPVANWKNMPIMPGAIAGQDDGPVYVFTIKATPEQVEEYYLGELKKLGWVLSSESTGNSQAKMLFFLQGDRAASVSLLQLPDDLTMVMLSSA